MPVRTSSTAPVGGVLVGMTPFTARCFLVASAMVLAVAGALAPLSGAPRAVVLTAAGCCAVLDVLLARWTRAAGFVDDVVLGPPAVLAVAEVDTGPVERVLRLGTGEQGEAVDVPTAGGVHLVVVGTGVLATAVFRALGVQLQDTAERSGTDVRAASATDLRGEVLRSRSVATDRDCRHDLPEGCAALVLDPAGPTQASLVLVPGPSHHPRRWDVAIDVTRYGCAVRRPGEPHGTLLSPALPMLGAPS